MQGGEWYVWCGPYRVGVPEGVVLHNLPIRPLAIAASDLHELPYMEVARLPVAVEARAVDPDA